MKDYRRIITNPFEFLSVDSLEIKQEINTHAVLSIGGLIADEKEEQYLGLLNHDTWIKVEAEDYNGEKKILFYGIITSYTIQHSGADVFLSLVCMSGTYLMDLKPHLRTFQSKKDTYSNILQHINQGYDNSASIIGRQGDDTLKVVMIQSYETDWEFIKRLSSYAGCYITADCHTKGSKYFFGMPDLNHYNIESERRYTAIKHMDDYLQKKDAGLHLSQTDAVTYVFDDRNIYRIGDHINFLNKELCIYRIHTKYTGGECVHNYYLRTLMGLMTMQAILPNIAGTSLMATVTKVKQDVVQVKVHQDENKMPDNNNWFLYSTVYSSEDGTGWYCMPEIGDQVRLHVPSIKEENAYVISAVHLKSDTSRQNPDVKSIKNKYGKEIMFTPDSLVLTNNDGLKIELTDQDGILIESSKAIQITAEGNLTISSNNSSVIVAGSEQVVMQQGSTNLTLNKDISFTGGEFRMQ